MKKTLKKTIHQYFPTYLYQAQLVPSKSKLTKALLKECYIFSEVDAEGIEWSKKNYPGGYTGYGSMANMYQVSPYFDELKKLIDPHVYQFVKHMEMDCRPQDIKMCSLWINIMPKGVTHSMHIHPLSVISGTFYVQVPKGTRGLKLEDPRMTNFMASPARVPNAKTINQRFIEAKPNAGQILLFESWMKHEVPPNPTNEDRISISFNYDWN